MFQVQKRQKKINEFFVSDKIQPQKTESVVEVLASDKIIDRPADKEVLEVCVLLLVLGVLNYAALFDLFDHKMALN